MPPIKEKASSKKAPAAASDEKSKGAKSTLEETGPKPFVWNDERDLELVRLFKKHGRLVAAYKERKSVANKVAMDIADKYDSSLLNRADPSRPVSERLSLLATRYQKHQREDKDATEAGNAVALRSAVHQEIDSFLAELVKVQIEANDEDTEIAV